jgi:hypothetical protein
VVLASDPFGGSGRTGEIVMHDVTKVILLHRRFAIAWAGNDSGVLDPTRFDFSNPDAVTFQPGAKPGHARYDQNCESPLATSRGKSRG